MKKYQQRPVHATLYKEGLEDLFVYYIPTFGLFSEEECIEAGFTPNFEKDKIPAFFSSKDEGVKYTTFSKNSYIVIDYHGNRKAVNKELFEAIYEEVTEF